MKIIKRDGRIQEYSWSKVEAVVYKAFKSIKHEVPDKFLDQLKQAIESSFKSRDSFTVEEMQDLIQKELIKRNKYEVVESFILYRNKRNEIREQKSDLIKQIQSKLAGTHIENQNANVDEASFGGRIGEAGRVVCKNVALKMMSKKSRKNHEDNIIYIHDLDSYASGMHNCLTEPLDDLLANGFTTRQTDVRPASSINTAMQLVAVCFQIQSLQQFGGVSASHLDHTMVPYVRKSFRKHYINSWIEDRSEFYDIDILGLTHTELNKWVTNMVTNFYLKTGLNDSDFTFDSKLLSPTLKQRALFLTKKETYQAVEGLYHNLNTLQSRSGNQLPFSSINFGTCTESEGRMITKALLEVSIEGLGKNGVTSIFPCTIFQYMKGVNDKPGTPNYDLYRLALRSTAQRLYPNYCNVDWSVNEGYDRNDPKTYMSTMGKRNTTAHLKSFEPSLLGVAA